jgi:hypothetical protein
MSSAAKRTICIGEAILAAGFILLAAQSVQAEPMKCSGENKTCLSACARMTVPAVLAACLDNCRSVQKACLRNGCWDNGSSRYCGLMKQ